MENTNNKNKYNKKYKFKYLGMKWRFLKFDLEKESLPPIENYNESKNEILQNQLILEKSIILDSYEKGLNLNQSIYESNNNIYHNHNNHNENNNENNNNNNLVNSLSLYEDSLNSLQQYTTLSEIDSVFTEQDLIRGIRNMQIFKSIEPIRPTPPTTARQQSGPSKAMVFSPRPPDGLKPSNIIIRPPSNIVVTTNDKVIPGKKYHSPRNFRKLKQKKTIPLKDQIQKLEISKNFKMYAIEKGMRIPECVKTVNIDQFDGVLANNKQQNLPQSSSKDDQLNQKSVSSVDLRKPMKL